MLFGGSIKITAYLVDRRQSRQDTIEGRGRTDRAVEVLKKQSKMVKAGEEIPWEDVTGMEEVIVSNPMSLLNSQDVAIDNTKTAENK